jgi:hypothetical protein
MDPVSPNVNTIRTVPRKINGEAAHSPPKDSTKEPMSTSPLNTLEPNMSSSLPQTQSIRSASSKLTPEAGLSIVDDTSTPVYPEKTNPGIIEQPSFTTETIYPSSSGITTSRLSEQTDSGDLNPNITQRMSKLFSLFSNYRK